MICMVSVCEYLEGSWAFTMIFIVFVCEGLVGYEPWIQRQRVCPLWGKKDGSSASLRLGCAERKMDPALDLATRNIRVLLSP